MENKILKKQNEKIKQQIAKSKNPDNLANIITTSQRQTFHALWSGDRLAHFPTYLQVLLMILDIISTYEGPTELKLARPIVSRSGLCIYNLRSL